MSQFVYDNDGFIFSTKRQLKRSKAYRNSFRIHNAERIKKREEYLRKREEIYISKQIQGIANSLTALKDEFQSYQNKMFTVLDNVRTADFANREGITVREILDPYRLTLTNNDTNFIGKQISRNMPRIRREKVINDAGFSVVLYKRSEFGLLARHAENAVRRWFAFMTKESTDSINELEKKFFYFTGRQMGNPIEWVRRYNEKRLKKLEREMCKNNMSKDLLGIVNSFAYGDKRDDQEIFDGIELAKCIRRRHIF